MNIEQVWEQLSPDERFHFIAHEMIHMCVVMEMGMTPHTVNRLRELPPSIERSFAYDIMQEYRDGLAMAEEVVNALTLVNMGPNEMIETIVFYSAEYYHG